MNVVLGGRLSLRVLPSISLRRLQGLGARRHEALLCGPPSLTRTLLPSPGDQGAAPLLHGDSKSQRSPVPDPPVLLPKALLLHQGSTGQSRDGIWGQKTAVGTLALG